MRRIDIICGLLFCALAIALDTIGLFYDNILGRFFGCLTSASTFLWLAYMFCREWKLRK